MFFAPLNWCFRVTEKSREKELAWNERLSICEWGKNQNFARNSFTIDKSLKWPVVCGGGQDSNRRASGVWETTNFSCVYKKIRETTANQTERERKKINFCVIHSWWWRKNIWHDFQNWCNEKKREQNRDELGTKSDRKRYEMLLLLQRQ